MTHEVAGGQQLDPLARIRLFARQGIFAKLGDVAYRRSLLLQKQRCRVVNDGAGGKSSADKRPCRMRLVALMIERLSAFIRKLDRQRRDQGATRKSQQTSERTLRKRNVETDRRASH